MTTSSEQTLPIDVIREALAHAAIAFQRCQLAAQHADIEGHDLIAAVLRSVSEGHSARAHVLLALTEPGPTGASRTAANVIRAVDDAAQASIGITAIAEAARRRGDAALSDAMEDLAQIAERMAQRLRSLPVVAKAPASGG